MISKKKAAAIIICLIAVLVLGLLAFARLLNLADYLIYTEYTRPAAALPIYTPLPVTDALPPAMETEIKSKAAEAEASAIESEQETVYVYEPYTFVPVFTMEPLPEDIIRFIEGVSFHYNPHFDHCFLTYLTITFVDFYGQYRTGNMIVAQEIGEEVLDIFREIFEYRFPIYGMRLIDYYDADDYLSMTANNSAAFNFRYIAGTRRLSRHAFGMAIDINPVQNPYIRGGTVWPAAGRYYMDREDIRPGMIVRGDIVYTAFTSRGWTWGGNWRLPRDYHHFER